MRASILLLACLFTGSVCFSPACKKEIIPDFIFPGVSDYGSEVAQSWNDKFLEIERDADGYRPLPATRALAYLGLSAYEACITGMPNYNSVATQYPGLLIPAAGNPESLHWPTVVNASYAYLMHHFFPTATAEITALEDLNNAVYQAQISNSEFLLAQHYGRGVAAAVWAWSKTDAIGHDAYLDPFKSHQYQPGNTQSGPKPLFPDWKQVRTFAISESDKICAEPWPYGEDMNSHFYAEAVEVYARTTNATYDNQWMLEFWSDDFLHLTYSTGSRWFSIANQVFKNDEVNLEIALYTNAKLGLAINDAAVACWTSKFHYQVENPVNYLQTLLDPAWEPLLKNPLTGETEYASTYASYPSEHATLAGAAAEVLVNIFGNQYAMTDRSHENNPLFLGFPRSFNSFYEMAEDCAASRIVSGLNYRMDCENGVHLGYKCGQKVNGLLWTN